MAKKKGNWKRIIIVFFGVFITAALVSSGSEIMLRGASLTIAWALLLVVVCIGIIFDIIGTAATAAKEAPHHSSAANKVKGAKQAVYIVRHADSVANFTNDIVGDIAGTLSGAMSATIVMNLLKAYPQLQPKVIVLNTLMLAFIASLTVTGKALGKTFAMKESNSIISAVGKALAIFEDITGWNLTDRKKRGGRKSGLTRKNT